MTAEQIAKYYTDCFKSGAPATVITDSDINDHAQELSERIKEYARQQCEKQRCNCYARWMGMPQWDDDSPQELRGRAERYILNAPEPEMD